MTTPAPSAIPDTMAGRRAKREQWEARHPADPAAGLVCISDQEVCVEDRRTKAIVGVRRVRQYADKSDLMTAVAERSDDGPLIWFGQQAAPPPPAPRVVGIIRRWPKGARPAADNDRRNR